jgi:hypothetical protein
VMETHHLLDPTGWALVLLDHVGVLVHGAAREPPSLTSFVGGGERKRTHPFRSSEGREPAGAVHFLLLIATATIATTAMATVAMAMGMT